MSGELYLPIAKKMTIAERMNVRYNVPMITDFNNIKHVLKEQPNTPIVLTAADGITPIMIVTEGCEPEEIQEIAIATYEKSAEKVKRSSDGTMIDYRAYRERNGYWQKEEFDPAFRNGLLKRKEELKRNHDA
jgi:hypothetical protein